MIPPASELGAPAWPRHRVAALALALAAAAALVRGLARPGRPMWLDEAFTLAQVRFMPLDFAGPIEASGGIHRLLLRAVFVLTDPFGADPLVAARGLSALLGVAAVPALYLLARRLLGETVGLLAGLLLVVNQFQAYYSIEARAYALLFLLAVLSTAALVELLEDPRPAVAIAFGLLAGLTTWAHLFGALLLAAQALAALFHPRLKPARSPLLGGLMLGGALSLAVLAWGARAATGQVDWVKPLSLDQVAMVLVRFTGSSRLLLLPFLGGLIVALVRLRRGGPDRFPLALAVSLLLVPLLLAVLVSAVKPLLVARYLMVSLPGFLLLTALGLAALPRRGLVVAAAVIFLGLGLREVVRDHRAEPLWQPIDRVAVRLLEVARPGDALLVSQPALSISLDRELGKLGHGPGPARLSPVAGDPLDFQAGTGLTLEERARGHGGVIFMLFDEKPGSARLREALQAGGAVTSDEWFDTVRLLRVERR